MFKACLTIFVSLILGSAFSGEIIRVESSASQIIGKKVFYYEDESTEISINEAIELANSGGFEQSDRDVFARPSSPATHWFTFSVESLINDAIWINVVNQGFNKVNFYSIDEWGNLIDSVSTGAESPMSTRQKKSKTFWFNLFQEQETGVRTIFLEITFSGILEVPIFLGGYNELEEIEDESELYGILFIGALLAMFIYNAFLGFFTKDPVYFYYVGYIFSVLLITAHVNNYPILPYFVGSYFTYQFLFLWMTPIAVFIALFIIRYLQLNKRAPKSALIIKVFAGISVAIGFSNIFVPSVYLTNAYQFSTVLLLITCLTVGFLEWKKGSRRAKFYTLGWAINILSVLIFIGVSNGFLAYTTVSRNAMYFGVFCELVIFSVALAERLNELKKQQEILNHKLETVNDNLVVSNESLDSFNYHVSHDLKTVLNNSNALTRMIQKYNSKNDSDKIAEIASKLLEVTQNGVETVQGFLSLSTVNALNRLSEQEVINLDKEIKAILLLNALDNDIKVEIIRNDLNTILIHKKAFQSIFLNFFTNTIKFNTRAPHAKIQFLQVDDTLQMTYEDNGIGIDLEKNGNLIFAPFERIKSSVKSEGSGVGMYLVKRLVENYGGSIKVQSKLNEGVKFIITLPANHIILKGKVST